MAFVTCALVPAGPLPSTTGSSGSTLSNMSGLFVWYLQLLFASAHLNPFLLCGLLRFAQRVTWHWLSE